MKTVFGDEATTAAPKAAVTLFGDSADAEGQVTAFGDAAEDTQPASLPPPREPTYEEKARPSLDAYQPPVGGLLKTQNPQQEEARALLASMAPTQGGSPAIAERMTREQGMEFPALGDPTTIPPLDRTKYSEEYQPEPLNRQGDLDVIPEFRGAAKSFAGAASAGTYQPELTPEEEPGRMYGAIPGSVAGGFAAGVGGPPGVAGFAYLSILSDLKARGYPVEKLSNPEIQALAALSGAASAAIPGAFGKGLVSRVLTGAALAGTQNVAEEEVVALLTHTNPESLYALLMGGAFGAGFGAMIKNSPSAKQALKKKLTPEQFAEWQQANGLRAPGTPEPEPAAGSLPGGLPVATEATARPPRPPAGGLSHGQMAGLNEGGSLDLRQHFFDQRMRAATEGRPDARAMREGGFFVGVEAPPDDMLGRQWLAGTEAQAALRAAEARRAEANAPYEEALRASVAAENALRDRFPDPEVSPRFPAERDLERALRARHQEAEAKVQELRAALDAANADLETARVGASRAQETPVPDLPPARARGRQEAIAAIRKVGLPPEQIRRAIEIMDDWWPELYELGARAVEDSPEFRREIGLGDGDVSRETSALLKSELPREAPRIRYETVDFGEESPFQRAFPEIQGLDFQTKSRLSREMDAYARGVAEEVTGIRAQEVIAEDDAPGVWEDYPMRPNAGMGAEVPFEKMQEYAAVQGYIHQQDAVFVMKEHDAGAKFGIYLDFEGGRPDPETLGKFWAELRKAAPDIAKGGAPTPGGLLIAVDAPAAAMKDFEAKYGEAMQRAVDAADLRGHAEFAIMDWDLVQSGGWKGEHGGQDYLGRLAEGQRQRLGNVHSEYEQRLRAALGRKTGEPARAGALLQERDAAHGRGLGSGPGVSAGISSRFGIDPAAIASRSPEGEIQVYKAMGNKIAEGRSTAEDLKIYPLHDIKDPESVLKAWSEKTGWTFKIFGPDRVTGEEIRPDFRQSYPQKTAWLYAPWDKHGAFNDPSYTYTWRVTHEVAHGMVNEKLTAKYGGEGKRAGALGMETVHPKSGKTVPPLSLADAMRAIEWEHETFIRQREILEKDFGIKITDEQFRKENSANMSDAMFRVLSGDFSNPGDRGLIPSAMNPDQVLARAKDILRQRAKDLRLDMAETFGPAKAVAQKGGPDIKGAFVPSTPEKQGMVYLIERKADFSTAWHEWMGHGIYDKVIKPNKELKSRADKLIVRDLGQEAILQDGEWTRDAHEWMAKKSEQYAYDGVTDVPEIKPLLEKIMGYMREVYRAVVNGPTGKTLDPEWRAFFDDVFFRRKAKAAPEETALPETPKELRVASERSQSTAFRPSRQAATEEKHVPGERSLPKTLEEKGFPGGDDRTYPVKANKETAEKGLAEVKAKGADAVANELLGQEEYSAEAMGKFAAVMQNWRMQAENAGTPEEKLAIDAKAGALAAQIGARSTSAGQFIQFISALGKYTRDGIVLYAGKVVEKWNRENPSRRPVKLAPEKVSALREAAKAVESEAALSDAAKAAEAALERAAAGKAQAEDIGALRAFRDRLLEYTSGPRRQPRGKAPEPETDSPEAMLSAREQAALERLRKKGLGPSKALLQAQRALADEDVADLADVFASRLAARGDRSVGAIRQSFIDSFGAEIRPHLDRIAQAGARKVSAARSERSRLAAVAQRIEEILTPLLESGDAAQADRAKFLFEEAFQVFKELQGDAKLEAAMDLQAALRELIPVRWDDRVVSLVNMSWLLAGKPLIRNLIGNEGFFRTERLVKAVIANQMDWARTKIGIGPKERTITFKTAGQSGFWKAFLHAKKSIERGATPEGLESKFDLGPIAWKGVPVLGFLEKQFGIVTRGLDYAAATRAANQVIGENAELAAMNKKIPSDQKKAFLKKYIENAPENITKSAKEYGAYVTYSDDNFLSKASLGWKRGLNKFPFEWPLKVLENPKVGSGTTLNHFARTPVNLLLRFLDYTPLGLVRAINILRDPVLESGLKTRESQMAFSRVLFGGGISMLAYMLAAKGVITGREEKDRRVANVNREVGVRNYQVNVSALKRYLLSAFAEDQLNERPGDSWVSYDWFQPLSALVGASATAYQRNHDYKNPAQGIAAGLAEGAGSAMETFMEMPMLQGMKKMIGGYGEPEDRIARILEDVPASLLAPTLIKEIKEYTDNKARSTAAPYGWQRALNKVIYKWPFVSKTLPEIYTAFGRGFPKEVYQDGTNSLFNVLANPAFVNKHELDPLVEAMLGPYEAEGRTRQFPTIPKRKMEYSDKGEKQVLELTGEEFSELQKSFADEIIRSTQSMDFEKLKKQSFERQEEELGDKMRKAWNKTRKQFLEKKGIKIK